MTRAYGRSGKCSLEEISLEKSPSTPVRMEELQGRNGFVANNSALLIKNSHLNQGLDYNVTSIMLRQVSAIDSSGYKG